jgi:hypothetical protein
MRWRCNKVVLLGVVLATPAAAVDKEVSLLTKQPMGELAVAGRLSVDLHAEFMVSRTYEHDTVLNWYICGYSGGGGEGGKVSKVGGNFGDFGFQVPLREREAKYPHAVTVDRVPAVRFDGGDFLKGNFEVEKKIAGAQNMALEVWLRSERPSKNEVMLGWQSRDGRETSAALRYPDGFKGSDRWRHLVVNCTPEREDWYLEGAKAGENRAMTLRPEHIRATQCYLGRGLKGGHFGGRVDRFTVHSVALAARSLMNP